MPSSGPTTAAIANARIRRPTLLARWSTTGGTLWAPIGTNSLASVVAITVGGGNSLGLSPVSWNAPCQTTSSAMIATVGTARRAAAWARTSGLERLRHAPAHQGSPLDEAQPDLLDQQAERRDQDQRREHDVAR